MVAVMMTRAGALGRLLHAALGPPFWRPLADLSYSAYLYHIQVLVVRVVIMTSVKQSSSALVHGGVLKECCVVLEAVG